jgi:beta-N-acetylhexosaminidase
MPLDLETLARGVLLPVSNSIRVEDHLLAFLDQGGRAILFGEEGDEFQTGRLRPSRLIKETPDVVARTLDAMRARAGGLLVACDADLAAVNRLQGLAGELPSLQAAENLTDNQLYTIMHDHACRARALGFTLFLSPTADLIEENAWCRAERLAANRLPGASSTCMCAL